MTEARSLDQRVSDLETLLRHMTPPPSPRAPGESGRLLASGTPRAGTVIPTLWRGLVASELRERWVDLGQWVEWMLDAYALDGDEWSAWWWASGAVEQLIGLRNWHHELVDVITRPPPSTPEAADDREGHDGEQTVADRRRTLAHDLVLWNEAAVSVAERLAGRPEGGPLLTRSAQAPAPGLKRRRQRRRDRREAFDAFLVLLEQVPGG